MSDLFRIGSFTHRRRELNWTAMHLCCTMLWRTHTVLLSAVAQQPAVTDVLRQPQLFSHFETVSKAARQRWIKTKELFHHAVAAGRIAVGPSSTYRQARAISNLASPCFHPALPWPPRHVTQVRAQWAWADRQSGLLL